MSSPVSSSVGPSRIPLQLVTDSVSLSFHYSLYSGAGTGKAQSQFYATGRHDFVFKLLMSWDIKPGQERTYDTFIVKKFIPGLSDMGLEPSEVWYSLWGLGPQMLMGCTTEDQELLQHLLKEDAWEALQHELQGLVHNYEAKVVMDNRLYFQL